MDSCLGKSSLIDTYFMGWKMRNTRWMCDIIKKLVLNFEIYVLQWNLPIADIPNSGHAMNSGRDVKYQMWQSFWNYFLIADTSQ